MTNKKLEVKIPAEVKGDLSVKGKLLVNNSEVTTLTTKSYTLEDPQGSSWVRIAKLTDPKLVSKGLVSLKPSGIRLDTYYNPIQDFTSETILSAGTSYRFKVNYDYTDHIDTISGQGLTLNITAGGSEAEITDNHTPKNFWAELSEIKYLEIGELYRPDDSVVGYNTTAWDYVDGNATLVFTNLSESPLEVFIAQNNFSEDEVKNNLENYNKVLVQPQETANIELEDQNQNLNLYIYNSNSEAVYMSCTHKVVGGRGRTTTNYATITPETDIQVKDILVQTSVENFDYYLTSLEQIRVEEVPVNFPYVQFKAVYDPLTNRADVNPILVSNGNDDIIDISSGSSSNNTYGSDLSAASEVSVIAENEVDLTETGGEETTGETITDETTEPTSSDEPVLTSDSDDEYMDSSSGSGSNIYDFGFKAATFECYDGQVYLDVLLHHPATNNYKDFNLTSTLEEAENLELLEEIAPHDLEAVLDRQLLEGSTFEKGVNYEFVISANYQDYIDAISQNKEINITYTPTTVEGEDLDPVTILKYNSAELIVLDSRSDLSVSDGTVEYPNHIVSTTPPSVPASTDISFTFPYAIGYTKLAGTIEATFDSPNAYKDVTADDIQRYLDNNYYNKHIKVISYEVLESSEDRSYIKFFFKLEGYFSTFTGRLLLGAIEASHWEASTLTIDPAETEFCLELPFTPEKTVIFDRYSIDNNDAYNFQLRANTILKSQTCEQFDLYSPQAVVRALDWAVSDLNYYVDRIWDTRLPKIEDKLEDLGVIDTKGKRDTKELFRLSESDTNRWRKIYDWLWEKYKYSIHTEFTEVPIRVAHYAPPSYFSSTVQIAFLDTYEDLVFNDSPALCFKASGGAGATYIVWKDSDNNWHIQAEYGGGTTTDPRYVMYSGTDLDFINYVTGETPLNYKNPYIYDIEKRLTSIDYDLSRKLSYRYIRNIDSSSTETIKDIWDIFKNESVGNWSGTGSVVVYAKFNETRVTFIIDFNKINGKGFKAICIDVDNHYNDSVKDLRVGDILEYSGDGTETLYQALLDLINAETEKDNIFESKTKVMRFI